MTLRRRRPGLVYPVNEDWHYVGEAGEPAFQNSWGNYGANSCLAFRIREAGVVDIQGDIDGGTAGSTVFTLPVAYRPSARAFYPATGFTDGGVEGVAMNVNIATSGNVNFSHRGTDPPTRFYVAVQFFLDPADAP